ncbi:SMI1/KNR4 family protein [Mumia qirimensis]|uniref:SMI1/KNR4 family protein n=1 Tax=Mumia qirimensis TaxID=3234852 RepID=UPI00351D568D
MDVDAAWDIIEDVLRARLPEVAATLRGPVSDTDLDRLTRTVGKELPTDFIQSLRRHDGQDNPTKLLDLFNHHTLLSAEAMVETSDMLADALGDDSGDVYDWMTPDKVRTVPNIRGWLPFTAAEGDSFALDLDPLPPGDPGQVISLPIDGPTPAPEHRSFRDWLAALAQRLDAGAFRIDDTLGLWLES